MVLVETVLVTGVGTGRALQELPVEVSPVIVVVADGSRVLPAWLERSADKVLVLDVREGLAAG